MRIVGLTGFHTFPTDLPDLLPDDEVIVLGPGDPLERAIGAEVAVAGFDPLQLRALLDGVPTLRWFHSLAAGVDRLIPEVVRRGDLLFTNNTGTYDAPIAEHSLATIFAAAKHLPLGTRRQVRREWGDDPRNTDLAGATLVILGLGSIGTRLGRLAEALGMRVIGVRRTAAPGVVTPDRLGEVAAEADYLAVCAALTNETRGIVSRDVIGRMKPTAWLINIARAALIDEAALFAACRDGRIAGAAIDTWWEEPLPPDNPWWELPNVIITPHIAYSSPLIRDRSVALFLDNLRRYRAGQPLVNSVDTSVGY